MKKSCGSIGGMLPQLWFYLPPKGAVGGMGISVWG